MRHPDIWNVPYPRNLSFTGRDDLLDRLRSAYTAAQPVALTQALGGLGGVGKTQLALEYSYRYSSAYRVVWWLRAEEPATLALDYAALATAFNLREAATHDQHAIIDAVRRWLEQHDRWLLIFDNAPEPTAIYSYFPHIPSGHILITSRHLGWGRIAKAIRVPTLPREASVQFLLQCTQQTDTTAATELATELGDLPLALAQAAAYIDAAVITLGEYLTLWHKHQEALLQRGRAGLEYPATMATTWNVAFQELQETQPVATDLLCLCAYLAPDMIQRALLCDGKEHLPEHLGTAVANDLAWSDAIIALRHYGLVEVHEEKGAISVHRIVQTVMHDHLAEERRQTWATTAVRLVLHAFALARGGMNITTYVHILPHAEVVAARVKTLSLPGNPERIQHELELLHTLGALLIFIRGYSTPQVEQVYERIQVLAQQVTEPTLQSFLALAGLRRFYLARGELQKAQEHAVQALVLAQGTNNEGHLLQAYHALGSTAFFQGNIVKSREHCEDCLALYESTQPGHSYQSYPLVLDPVVACHSYRALTLWLLGYPDQARKQSQEAVALARALNQPFSESVALLWAAGVYQFCRDPDKTQEFAELAMDLAHEKAFAFWEALGKILQGWAWIEQQQHEKGMTQIRATLDGYKNTGAVLGQPYYLALLAEAYVEVGQADAALERLEEALKIVEKNGEHWWEAELYRLKGELLLSRGTEATLRQAEICLQAALGVACRQQAKSLQLRVAMSLSRLRQDQQLLEPIYHAFTEGFDTADLQAAKKLLTACA